MNREEYVQRASDILKKIHDNLDDDVVDILEAELLALEDKILEEYNDRHDMTKILVEGGSKAGIY